MQKPPNSTVRTFLVTGATGGIGQAVARLFLAKGHRVIATVRSQPQIDKVQETLGSHAHVIAFDLSSDETLNEGCKAIASLLEREHLGIDALVNNAGTVFPGPLAALSMDDLRQQFEVNFFSPIGLTRALLPWLKESKGTIVNISSVSGRVVIPLLGAYAASKHALVAASDALRMELRPLGIRVVCIHPGNVRTPIWHKAYARAAGLSAHEGGDWMAAGTIAKLSRIATKMEQHGSSAENVATAVLHAIENPEARPHIYVGLDARIVVPLAHLLPTSVFDWLRLKRLSRV